ncbi:MAG: hypothetical protein BroJett014_23970 [Planctomycetota bacterium]|nr:MAG: hypothetical protein BroJett014_23970 [Planctomycetota bacterium]
MNQLKFIRTTHDGNGRCRSFPPEAWRFWREQGTAVGEVLRTETPLTLAEVLTASREYALEHPDSLMYADVTEEQVAWRLLKLCEVGMAAVVIEPIPPARSLH